MYSLESIEVIDFELTSFCNAKCPQCPRFDMFGNLNVKPTNLDFDLIKSMPIKKLINLRTISLIGNFGDPLMHPEIDKILNFFDDKEITISTNASLRHPNWWSEIAKKIPNISITFCIDGLEDTHSLYRRNTSYKKVIENAKNFIDNGGKAEWQFIVFKHNEHQIEKAKNLSKKLGFKNIKFMYSDRFDTTNIWKVYDNHNYLYDLEKSSKQVTLREKLHTKEGEKYWKNMLHKGETKNIDCVWSKNKKIYIHSDGTIFPCCWIAGIKQGRQIEKKMYEKIIKNWHDVNLYTNSFENIINGPYYREYFTKSLSEQPHPTCIEHCNKTTGKFYQTDLNNV